MELVNDIQADILEHLARFTFLSISQLKSLTGMSLQYVREQVAILGQKKYVKSYHVEVAKVRAENIFYLTSSAKILLLENNKVFAHDIKLPIGVPLVVRDYHHRKHFVDLHISFYNYCKKQDITILTFLTYFDKAGNNRRDGNLESLTKISIGDDMFFMPDGIAITEQGDTQTLYLLEMYNGKDTIRTIAQLAKHAKAISLGSASKKYDIQANPFVLSVFEFESSKQAVIKRLQTNERFKVMSKLFFFASLDDVKRDFGNAWKDINDTPLFNRHT